LLNKRYPVVMPNLCSFLFTSTWLYQTVHNKRWRRLLLVGKEEKHMEYFERKRIVSIPTHLPRVGMVKLYNIP